MVDDGPNGRRLIAEGDNAIVRGGEITINAVADLGQELVEQRSCDIVINVK
jgi:hypothetical protein